MNKIEKIVDGYKKAHFSDDQGYSKQNHSFLREDVIFHMYEIMDIFRKVFLLLEWTNQDIKDKKILEIGCAWGLRTNQLIGFGFSTQNLYGIDLIDDYIVQAKKDNPKINYKVMSATNLDFSKDTFELSFAAMALSAMLDKDIIKKSLDELIRVTKNGILIVDNFQENYTDSKEEIIYLKGISQDIIKYLAEKREVAYIKKIRSFWTTSTFMWRFFRILKKIGLDSIAYALVIRGLSSHSHHAYFIKLDK